MSFVKVSHVYDEVYATYSKHRRKQAHLLLKIKNANKQMHKIKKLLDIMEEG
jgi:hypothetical protein